MALSRFRSSRHFVRRVALAAAVLGTTGCQNSLRVRVELVDIGEPIPLELSSATGGDRELSPRGKSEYRSRVKKVLSIIAEDRTGLDSFKLRLGAIGYTNDTLDGPQFAKFAEHSKSLDKLFAEAKALAEKPQPTGKDVESLKQLEGNLAAELAQSGRLFSRVTRNLQSYDRPTKLPEGLDEEEFPQKKREAISAGESSLERTTIATQELAAEPSGGFGGFRVLGVHRINAADPAYHRIVNSKRCKPAGVFSEVESRVNGDSTIVFVQENPTQFRVFEIDNDPSALMRNVAYLMDKVLQAVVKYSQPASPSKTSTPSIVP